MQRQSQPQFSPKQKRASGLLQAMRELQMERNHRRLAGLPIAFSTRSSCTEGTVCLRANYLGQINGSAGATRWSERPARGAYCSRDADQTVEMNVS